MFLVWLAIIIIIGVAENIKDSYDAYKFHQSREYNDMLKRFHHL